MVTTQEPALWDNHSYIRVSFSPVHGALAGLSCSLCFGFGAESFTSADMISFVLETSHCFSL